MINTNGLSPRDVQELQKHSEMLRFKNAECDSSRPTTAGDCNKEWAPSGAASNSLSNQTTGMGAGVGQRLTEEVTLENLDEVMRYQPWMPEQVQAGDIVREALTAAVRAILRVVPRCPSRTKAVNHLIDARMDANAGISFRGRF